MTTTIKEAQQLVKSLTIQNGWSDDITIDKFDHLHEELIEMSKLLRYKNKQERTQALVEHKFEFADGIGDLFFGLCRLANQLGVDVEEGFKLTQAEFIKKYGGKPSEAKPVTNRDVQQRIRPTINR